MNRSSPPEDKHGTAPHDGRPAHAAVRAWRVDSDALLQFATRLLATAGCSDAEAAAVARHLVDANLCGHDSHGVARIPRYLQMVAEGLVVPNQSISIIKDDAVMLLLDGNIGFGPVIAEQVVALGCTRAAQHGVAVVGLRNASHLGRIGAWAEAAAARGMLSIHFVNIRGRSIVAPFGGIDRRMATSPIAIGAPLQGEPPLILDFATSLVAEGKALMAATGGERLPSGALVSGTGQPSSDPADLYGDTVHAPVPNASRGSGALAIFGGHKGSGLNFMIELIAGALTGNGVNRTFRDIEEQPFRNGMLSIFIDPERFAGRAYFETELRDYAAYVRSARPAAGHDAVLLPGDKERLARVARTTDGIEIGASGWAKLTGLAERLGVTLPPSTPLS